LLFLKQSQCVTNRLVTSTSSLQTKVCTKNQYKLQLFYVTWRDSRVISIKYIDQLIYRFINIDAELFSVSLLSVIFMISI